MSSKWVDNTEYFGPDRRKGGGKRLLDRRRQDLTGEPPPLGAMLRRLRVRLGSAKAEDIKHAADMFAAAIAEANRLGWRECAAALSAGARALHTGTREGAERADAHVSEALDHAAFRR